MSQFTFFTLKTELLKFIRNYVFVWYSYPEKNALSEILKSNKIICMYFSVDIHT